MMLHTHRGEGTVEQRWLQQVLILRARCATTIMLLHSVHVAWFVRSGLRLSIAWKRFRMIGASHYSSLHSLRP
eukprot:jgi/Ulvmu1/5238/UM022_0031.1